MPTSKDTIRLSTDGGEQYATRLASGPADVRLAQALRFEVFNLELKEGLAGSYATGLDQDPFDAVCDHLLVEERGSGRVVGTYRLQTGTTAKTNLGFYSEQEFDFAPYEPLRDRLVELGRACVHLEHRNLVVLGLLWKGIADYAVEKGARWLCGCSSITTQDPAVGASAYLALERYLVEPQYRTVPTARFDCPLDRLAAEEPEIPKLLKAYLTLGARICGPPALDREFHTIDFLTLLDLDSISEATRKRFLR